MDWDHLAEERSQRLFSGWLKVLLRESPALPLRLAARHRPGAPAVAASDYTTGSYNMCCFVTFEDGFRVLVRFPILGRSWFRLEKSQDELLVMGFLARHTRVPMPTLLGAGMWECGPYMVMTVAEGTLLSKCLRVPDLERAYCGMANVMLELSKLALPRIGGIEFDSGDWKVSKRPMTLNMNELVRVGNYPPGQLPEHSFQSASEYFQDLARQQFLHLEYQRNDAVTDEDDCRKKYIARCLFQKIAKQIATEPGPFRLYCDDFRPSNVLVSESDLKVTAVIDWEFTYAAPAEFTYTAPWWLLFESPEAWEEDLNKFLDRYKPRLHLFLRALRTCEDEQLRNGTLSESQRLSDRMAQSLDNGLFWFCLAARKSFMFDDIYWAFLDERHFGRLSSLDDRLSLLTQEERDGLSAFVEAKMQQVKEGTLDEHMPMEEIIDL